MAAIARTVITSERIRFAVLAIIFSQVVGWWNSAFAEIMLLPSSCMARSFQIRR